MMPPVEMLKLMEQDENLFPDRQVEYIGPEIDDGGHATCRDWRALRNRDMPAKVTGECRANLFGPFHNPLDLAFQWGLFGGYSAFRRVWLRFPHLPHLRRSFGVSTRNVDIVRFGFWFCFHAPILAQGVGQTLSVREGGERDHRHRTTDFRSVANGNQDVTVGVPVPPWRHSLECRPPPRNPHGFRYEQYFSRKRIVISRRSGVSIGSTCPTISSGTSP